MRHADTSLYKEESVLIPRKGTLNIDFAGMNVGSAVPIMTTEVLNNLPIGIPPDYLVQQFEDSVSCLFKKMRSNQNQIRTLEKLRDTLLPKLMSGEVRVKYGG